MFGREVPGFPNAYCLEQTMVLSHGIITSRQQHFTLTDLPPFMEAKITETLTEMAQEVHQPKGRQEVSNLLITGVP